MKRTIILLMIFGLGSGILLSQNINLKIGICMPSMQSDLWEDNMQNLAFNKTDLISSYFGIELEMFLNRYSSLSLEIGSYNNTTYSQYKDYTYQDGSPIFQNISLRITPMEVGVKFYPLSHSHVFCPYFGAGAGLYAWTYQQWGDFIIFPAGDIVEGFAETKTYSFGLNARAGLVFRFHPRVALAIEGKYQYLRGRLSEYFEGFELLDLGGITATFGVNIYMR
jgi:hypothetical protein